MMKVIGLFILNIEYSIQIPVKKIKLKILDFNYYLI
jgi:hypothetical protein